MGGNVAACADPRRGARLAGVAPYSMACCAPAEVVSPEHTMIWRYGTSVGKYLVLCFWPSKVDGTPHAFMGMWKVFRLT